MRPSDPQQAAPDPDDEIIEGRAELARGDCDEALVHAARAVAVAPERDDVVAFADEAIRSHRAPLDSIGNAQRASYGLVALRARALAAGGKWIAAATTAIEVATFRPALPYIQWAVRWLEQAESISASEADTVLTSLVSFTQHVLAAPPAAETFANVAAAADSVGRIAPRTTDRAKALLVQSMLLRRAGRPAEGVTVAQEAYRARPTWMTCAELANALRDAGRLDEAAVTYRRAADHDPTDLTAWLDLADVHLRRKAWNEAEIIYRRVLDSTPHDVNAITSLTYLQARHGDRGARARLQALASTDGEQSNRARALLAELEGPL